MMKGNKWASPGELPLHFYFFYVSMSAVYIVQCTLLLLATLFGGNVFGEGTNEHHHASKVEKHKHIKLFVIANYSLRTSHSQ